MPDKPRHGKGRYNSQSKKRREQQRTQTPVTQTQAAAQPAGAAASTGLPATKVKATAASPMAVPSFKYRYISTELRRITILSGTIIAILIVLVLILR